MSVEGEIAGKYLFKPILEIQKNSAAKIETHIFGNEHLAELPRDQCVLFTGNYPGPAQFYGKMIPGVREKIRFASGFVPSSFILLTQTEKLRSKHVSPVMASVMDSMGGNGELILNNQSGEAFMASAITAMGGIPVNKSEGGRTGKSNETFLRGVRKTAQPESGSDILVFVEGHWRNKNEKLTVDNFHPEIGVAHVAMGFNLPIVPFYIYCPEGWSSKNEEQSAFIVFGEPIYPETEGAKGKGGKQHLTEVVARRIISLQERLKTVCPEKQFPF